MTETARSDERAEVVVLRTVTTPWIELESWVTEARNYIDRTLAKINKPEGDKKLELPPSMPDLAPWMRVRLIAFSVENVENDEQFEQFELGRVVIRADDPDKRAYVALPLPAPATSTERRKVTISGTLDDGEWLVRQVGEAEVTYVRDATAPPDKQGSMPRPERHKVVEIVQAVPIRATKTRSDFVAMNEHEHEHEHEQWSIAAELHRTAVILFERQVCRAALRLLDSKVLDWPREPLSSFSQSYLAADLLKSCGVVKSAPRGKKGQAPAKRDDRNIDRLRQGLDPDDGKYLAAAASRRGEMITTSEAVEIVHNVRIQVADGSAKGTTTAKGAVGEYVRNYRDRLSERGALEIDPLLPSASEADNGGNLRAAATSGVMKDQVEQALSTLHLYARQLAALGKISTITKFENGAYPEFRRAWLAARRAAAQLHPGSTEYQAAVAARKHAVQYCALSRHVAPEHILIFAPDLIDRLVDGPMDRALEDEVLAIGHALLAHQRSRSQA